LVAARVDDMELENTTVSDSFVGDLVLVAVGVEMSVYVSVACIVSLELGDADCEAVRLPSSDNVMDDDTTEWETSRDGD
jgi:hypothetical protein